MNRRALLKGTAATAAAVALAPIADALAPRYATGGLVSANFPAGTSIYDAMHEVCIYQEFAVRADRAFLAGTAL